MATNCVLHITNRENIDRESITDFFERLYFVKDNFSNWLDVPWKDYYLSNIEIGGPDDIIRPTSTAYWIYGIKNYSNGTLGKIDLQYLDTLEENKYEVKAKFSDSNEYVYGIINVTEAEKEPDTPVTPDNPVTPKTGDYILFTIIVAIIALIISIVVYKKIEY